VSTQSPIQEVAERVAETAPGLVAAAHAEALQNLRQMNADHRRRVADSHRWQADVLGQKATDPPEEDDVGNLIVTGDVYGDGAAEIVRSLQGLAQAAPEAAGSPSEPSQQTGWASSLAKAALVTAGLLGGGGLGAGVPWLLGAYDKPESVNTTVVQPADTQGLGVEVVPGGATE